MDKHTSNTVHALRRAKERYGLDLTAQELENILAAITKNKADGIFCRKYKQQSLRRTIWLVQYKEHVLIPVVEVNKKAKRVSIVTFLPNDL